jgi:hypothetical protein
MSSSTRPLDDEKHQIHQKQTTGPDDDQSVDMEEVGHDKVKASSRLEVADQTPARDSLLSWFVPSFLSGSTACSTAEEGNAPKTASATSRIGAKQKKNSDDEHLRSTSSAI